MTVPTPPAVSEAMREAAALAKWLREKSYACGWKSMALAMDLRKSGPIASEIARLTGERDAAVRLAEAAERNLIARIRTDEAETARLRAEVADALAQGRREGLKEAAKVAQELNALNGCSDACVAGFIIRDIRSLATAPTETQKPEETA